jgi:preprotein translocase subunit SecF
MKQISTKILVILIALILIVGTIMLFTKGLAFNIKYQNAKKLELNIGKEFTISEMKEITDEVFEGQPVLVRQIEVYKDAANIITTEITEEQKSELVSKINEKYGTELDAEDITIEENAHIRGRDMIKPYVLPFIIATVIALLYIVIRYYKLNALKVLAQAVGIIILSQLVLLGIMAITRMPIGRFTIPSVLLVYILSMYICTTKFDGDLEKIKVEEKN